MDFANERYVRLYVRDTMTWKRIGWEGRAVLPQLLRKLDRSGVFDLSGLEPCEAVAAMLDMPIEVARPGTERLIETGTLELGDDCLVVPRFLEGQETPQTEAHRAREYRARRRDKARGITESDATVTKGDETVTPRHTPSRAVTPSVPSVPSVPEETTPYVNEPGEPVSPTRPPKPEVSQEEILEAWRAICVPRGAPDIRELTADRRRRLAQRLREHPTFEWWDELFKRVSQSRFLFGSGERGWRISIDWLIANGTNGTKVLEGKYDEQIPRPLRSAGTYHPA